MEEKTNKRELIEEAVLEFKKLNEDNKMFILGYMLGIQQGRQAQTAQEGTTIKYCLGQQCVIYW